MGVLLGIAATALAVATGATGHPVLSVIAMVAVVNVIALISTWRAALATAVVCWLLHDGFVLGRYGELALVGQAGHDALVIGLDALGVVVLVSTLRAALAPMLHLREGDPSAPRVPVQRQPVFTQSQRRMTGS
ncbi:hypothetical protein [Lentzea nigeriaca]|uniref:hypothetical protein n=1 Tax=Lentzea nigeriaca TaxID=1128665 RepID=UPI00195B8DB9|nr:hypothetical protein [Lentzea nigeriaca]MBM7860685.1 hypothetical protein [Lentzea nigeriaca]